MTRDPFHDAERFGVVRYRLQYAVIDKQAGAYVRKAGRIHVTTQSAAHRLAERLNAKHRVAS